MESFRESVSFCELEERDSQAKENPLRDMFASSSSRTLNFVELTYEETQPSARWELPHISPFEVYSDLAPFHLIVASRISIKESVSQVQENFDNIHTISLLNPKFYKSNQRN